jgi:hypothetical protein
MPMQDLMEGILFDSSAFHILNQEVVLEPMLGVLLSRQVMSLKQSKQINIIQNDPSKKKHVEKINTSLMINTSLQESNQIRFFRALASALSFPFHFHASFLSSQLCLKKVNESFCHQHGIRLQAAAVCQWQ